MQDVWKQEPYIVIEKLQDNVYKVRSINNYGETKDLHMKEILDTTDLSKMMIALAVNLVQTLRKTFLW